MKLWKEIILGNRFEWAEINMGWSKAKSWKRLIAEKLQGWALSYSEKMGIILLRKAAAYLCSELKADFPRHLIYHSSPYSFSVKSAPPHITGPCSRCHKLPCIKTENGIRFLWLLHDPSFSPCTQKNGDTRNLAPVKCFGLDDLQRSLSTSAILWFTEQVCCEQTLRKNQNPQFQVCLKPELFEWILQDSSLPVCLILPPVMRTAERVPGKWRVKWILIHLNFPLCSSWDFSGSIRGEPLRHQDQDHHLHHSG